MSNKEQKRLMVLNSTGRGELACGQGAEPLGLWLRQLRRMLARYRKEGAAALAHGNRGRKPQHATAEDIKKRVVTLAETTYACCDQHQHKLTKSLNT